ncbi:MAG TPA: nitronate monooxygenase [Terracidiphilus sp.]|nr:nitronate monooxygenase [Terracidiphilus sp.]
MIQFPAIIQGGMGIGVSNWRLANAVSRLGQLGVVSGTALDTLFLRRLVDGDKGGHMHRGLEAFPFPAMARRVWREYFVPGGKAADAPYPMAPMHQKAEPRKLIELCIVSNFVEVFLAREGHDNPVGVNYLEKVQLPHLASIYGAMLAGVGYVLMGAGIPLHIPAVLDAYAAHRPAEYKLSVTGATTDDDTRLRFDPAEFVEGPPPQLERPKFLAIVSSNALAATMLRRASGRVDGLVIESPTAGGHNAPPRGKLQLSEKGEPIYGERDQVNLAELRALGAPFWLAGGYGSPAKLREAVEQGAAGVQVGTAFAFSQESGLRADLKHQLLAQAASGSAQVFTDPLASPTGFPFKVAQLEGTLSEPDVYQQRKRVCDLGYLREAYRTPDGKLGYRCSAEPVANLVAKGGKEEDTTGRKCLCNALLANVGHAQVRAGREGDGREMEPPLVTVGDDLNKVAQFLAPGSSSYSAQDVVRILLSGLQDAAAPPAAPAEATRA